jgi:hypothetical protein
VAVHFFPAPGLVAKVANRKNGLKATFLYNPAMLSREELRSLFVARHAERDRILSHIRAAGSSPQHSLVIGERGMGKTTLLLRLAHSVEEEPDLRTQWIAVRFDEEQYNIGELAHFWLNCLEKIGEDTGDPEPIEIADRLIREFPARSKDRKEKSDPLEEAAFLRLKQYSIQHGRRLLLLVDNLDLLLARLDPKQEAHRLREVLQQETRVMLVGASTHPIVATFDYESPFYDLFDVILLNPLDFQESLDFLRKLGTCFHREITTADLIERRGDDLSILHTLAGGNLRTITLLFSLLQEDPAAELRLILDRLLDQYTSSYKDAIEALPTQGQRVFDALARAWNPATAEDVAQELRIERGVASAQLHRLVERDLAAKVQLPQRSLGFQIRDRFFSLWYLMRGGRRRRPSLHALLGFLEIFQRRRRTGESAPVISRLQRLGLLKLQLLAEAREEAALLAELEKQPQGEIFAAGHSRARLLAYCLRQQYDRGEEEAKTLLLVSPGDGLVRASWVYLLERRGEARDAFRVLADNPEIPPPAWLRLERARLSVALRDVEVDLPLLLSLMEADIPAGEIADLAVALAQRGEDKLIWPAQGLLSQALERAPQDPQVLLAGCEVELILERPKQAFIHLRNAFEAAQHSGTLAESGPLLDMALRLGAGQPNEVLDVLKATGLAESWVPLTHALAFLGGESDRLETLAPEMRKFTEWVIEAIRKMAAVPTPQKAS